MSEKNSRFRLTLVCASLYDVLFALDAGDYKTTKESLKRASDSLLEIASKKHTTIKKRQHDLLDMWDITYDLRTDLVLTMDKHSQNLDAAARITEAYDKISRLKRTLRGFINNWYKTP